METSTISWVIVFLGLAAVVAELIVGVQAGFDLVLIGSSLIIGGLVGNFTGNLYLALGATASLSFLYVLVGRSFVRKRLQFLSETSNVDSLIGEEGVVTKEIKKNHPGQVRVGTELWRATIDKSANVDNLPKGEKIRVTDVSGVTVKVDKWS